jgi:hypothetical protein
MSAARSACIKLIEYEGGPFYTTAVLRGTMAGGG